MVGGAFVLSAARSRHSVGVRCRPVYGMTGATQPATSIVTAKSVNQFVSSLLMVRVLRCERARGDAMSARLACFLGLFVFRVMIPLLCDNASSWRRQKLRAIPTPGFSSSAHISRRNKQVFVSCRLSRESVLATRRQFIEFVAPGIARITAIQGLQRYGMDSAIHRVQP